MGLQGDDIDRPLILSDIESCVLKENHCIGLSQSSKNLSESRKHKYSPWRRCGDHGKVSLLLFKKTGMGLQQRQSLWRAGSQDTRMWGLWPKKMIHPQGTGTTHREARQGISEETTSNQPEELVLTFHQAQKAQTSGADRSVVKSQHSTNDYFQST